MPIDTDRIFTLRDAKMIESFIDGVLDHKFEDGRPMIPDVPFTKAYDMGVKWRLDNMPFFEAKQVVDVWDSLPGGTRHSVAETQNWMYVMATVIHKLRVRLGMKLPEGATPPNDY